MKVQCKYTELVPIEKLVPNPKNPNVHSEKQVKLIAKLLEHQGWRHPIIVSKRSGFIVVGHCRFESAKLNGYEQVPVDYQDFESEAVEYQFLISDNNSPELAQHNDSMMIDEIKLLGLDDFELLGMDDFSLPLEPDEAKEEIEDDVPEVTETRCKPGDLWVLGDHRLLCGDSTNVQHVEKLMGGEKADMVFTDPPYGVGYKYESHNDDVTQEQHFQFLKDLISLSLALCDKFILTPGCKNLETVLKINSPDHIGCWTKTNAMSPGRITHFWTWEPIIFWGKWK